MFRHALTLAAIFFVHTVMALDSDRDQPATVEADEVEYDFRTGVRTYKGDVVVEQGSLRITGDKLVVLYVDDEMEKATVWGNLASFKQRPEGKTQDVIGKGKKIVLDQTVNTVTLYTNASLSQGNDEAKGDLIVYDISRDKLSVQGGASTATDTAEQGETSEEPAKPKRARVVITPTQTAPAE